MHGASTMRNAVKRVTHKERSQPLARKKFGLLEKHKDYVERARDFHKKQDRIKILRKKAAERNPDEFYFNMHNSQVRGGVHKSKKDGSLTNDTVQLLKTQDMGYVVHKKAVDDRKAEKLRDTLHLIGEVKPKLHKVFVDEEAELEKFDAAKHFGTTKELVSRSFNRPKVETIEKMLEMGGAALPSAEQVEVVMEKRAKAYKELGRRAARSKKLHKVVNELALQRNLMGKGSKRKIRVDGGRDGGDSDDEKGDSTAKFVYKWKRQRSR
jgi:U3 small nucleolar RNA-associated protein 11